MSERTPMNAISGLSRIAAVPPPPPRPKREEHDPDQVATQDAPQPAPAKKRQVQERKANTSAAATRPITLSLPVSLLVRVKERARRDSIAQYDVLLDAIVSTQAQLGELIKNPEVVEDGLFVRRSANRAASEPLTTLALRMLTSNVDAIDQLVHQHRAESRSALCVAALRAYLDDPKK